ncbi:MAG TPA: OmpH family outer membrane protein [Candidatus Elarobacter sp.]
MIRRAALLAAAALASCAHGTGTTSTVVPGTGAVGYVRMEELVQKHPLYEQLARYDRSIDAFDLTETTPRAVAVDPTLRGREKALEKELNDAADRTKKLLDQKQRQYQQQEADAIAAALRGAGIGGSSASQIAGSLDATARQQQGSVAAQAQRDFDAYRTTLANQDRKQIAALQKALADKAERQYRARADELQGKEQAIQLQMRSEDAGQRLALRTKLSSLALDDAAREDAQKQLAVLDRREADAVAAQHNRDQQTLSAYQAQLHDEVQKELNQQVAAIQKRSVGSLTSRQQTLASQVRRIGGPVIQNTTVGGRPYQQVNPNLPPALRTRIQQLHDDYQKRFQDDAKTTIADFQKKREDLSRRYAELHGVDVAAQRGAQTQVLELRKKREDLYTQITAQIDREVKVIAQQRGIAVVLSDVVAPAGGVDLTPDALKDIESLHE